MAKIFTIVVGSHYFKIIDPKQAAMQHIRRFAFRNTEIDLSKDPISGQMIRQPKKIYAARKLDNSEFRFAISQFDEFVNFLDQQGVRKSEYEVITRKLYEPMPSKIKLPETWVPRPKQVPIIDYMVAEGYCKIITLQTGQGKMERLSNLIRVPGGKWKKMGDIVVGDEVIAADGTHTRVKGVFPHPEQQLWKVTFGDGRSVEVGADHLWSVYLEGERCTVIDTATLRHTVEDSDTPVFLPTVLPDNGNGLDTPLSPTLHNAIVQQERLIPDVYLEASADQRYALVRDILGHHNRPYMYRDRRFAEQLQYMVRSLGGWANIDNGELRWSIPTLGNGMLEVVGVEPSVVEPAQCISIEHPSQLYVTQNFIVTHNTASSLKAAELIGHRLLIVVLGRYFDKWIGDVYENYGLEDGSGDLLAIRGFKALKQFMMDLEEEEHIDFEVMIITTTTMADYIRAYEDPLIDKSQSWWIDPEDFCERTGVGIKLTDEIHQHFHANFIIDLYAHVPKTFGLSATLESDQPFETRMYEIAYPTKYRKSGGSYIKYINVKALHYQIADIKRIRHKQRGAYNHIQFEKSLFKQKKVFRKYLMMIQEVVIHEYLEKRRDEDQKMLIFAANVFMCEEIRDYLRGALADKNLKINKYTSEDDLEVITQDSHICVTTIGSAGTAIDIPGLILSLMTTAIANPKANLQALGRTREIHKYPDQDPTFVYLVCDSIPKHRQYHTKKKELFRDRVLTHSSMQYNGTL